MAGHRFYTFEHLQKDYLNENPHWVIQSRNGQDILQVRHRQYSRACGPFSVGMICEYLGYANFQEGANYMLPIAYGRNREHLALIDVGYHGSCEHVMAEYVSWGTRDWEVPPEQGESKFLFRSVYNDITTKRCSKYFTTGSNSEVVPTEYRGTENLPLYGPYPNRNSRVLNWLNGTGMGISGSDTQPDALKGMVGFANRLEMFGCNDARFVKIRRQEHLEWVREVIKGYVDNNIPIVMVSRGGQHFMTVVGYSELDSQGLPTAMIVSNTHLTRDSGWTKHDGTTFPGPRPAFWVFDELDQLDTWTKYSSDDEYFGNVNGLLLWNQHLDGGGESDGWARELDTKYSSVPEYHKLCTMPDDMTVTVAPRIIGTTIICQNYDTIHRDYHVYPEDPFVIEPQNTTCDSIIITHKEDTQKEITEAKVIRYAYELGNKRWVKWQTYTQDRLINQMAEAGAAGTRSTIHWDNAWPDDHWLSADNLQDSTHTARRTTIELSFDDGSRKNIEISPRFVYGIQVRFAEVPRSSKDFSTHIEPNRRFFNNCHYAAISGNRSCDRVIANISLGTNDRVIKATLKRYGFNHEKQAWKQLQVFQPDEPVRIVELGLTGLSHRVEWNPSWSDNYWWVAKGLSGKYSKRKTVLVITFQSGDTREVHFVPEG